MNVYVYQAVYGEGNEFEQDIHVEVFRDEEKALKELKKDYKKVLKEFVESGGYDKDELVTDTSIKNTITLSADHHSDWWEGTVFEMKVK